MTDYAMLPPNQFHLRSVTPLKLYPVEVDHGPTFTIIDDAGDRLICMWAEGTYERRGIRIFGSGRWKRITIPDEDFNHANTYHEIIPRRAGRPPEQR